MNRPSLRQLSLRLFLGFLALTAAIAIVTVLAGSFGDLQVKILLTTLSISGASVLAMACAAFIEKRGGRAVGLMGVAAAAWAAAMVIALLWLEIDGEAWLKLTFSDIVVAVALAHGCLLALPELGSRWVRIAAFVCIGLLAAQIVVAVWAEIDDSVLYRTMAVLAILVAGLSLAIPILSRLERRQPGPTDPELRLRRIAGEIWADEGGRRYRVTEAEDPRSAGSSAGLPEA